MGRLDVVGMVVSPSSTHSLWLSVVWDDVTVISELFVADRAFPVLLDNFVVQKLPHLGWRP